MPLHLYKLIGVEAGRPQEALLCAKAKRQQQMFSVAKAKRQLQSAQPERKSTTRYGDELEFIKLMNGHYWR